MPKVKKDNERNALAAGQINKGLQIKGRLWVENEGRTYLSWGRIILLERIDEYGSVSAAAKSMQMSFAHAWHLVEDMNALAPQPLVEKQVGGVLTITTCQGTGSDSKILPLSFLCFFSHVVFSFLIYS